MPRSGTLVLSHDLHDLIGGLMSSPDAIICIFAEVCRPWIQLCPTLSIFCESLHRINPFVATPYSAKPYVSPELPIHAECPQVLFHHISPKLPFSAKWLLPVRTRRTPQNSLNKAICGSPQYMTEEAKTIYFSHFRWRCKMLLSSTCTAFREYNNIVSVLEIGQGAS
ncbi:hypothetical protein RB195_014309 [Necator americanus]|uniref:Uncharacterized protein n=1 Tax=Necator americanus TaxID=51031 RepID=A0ABR1E013_NECAM